METKILPPIEILLTTNEAAKVLGLPPQTLVNWRHTGRYPLPFIRVGRLIRYRSADLNDWIEENRVVKGGEV